MKTKNVDFGYLIEQLYTSIGETHSQVFKKYKDLPVCLMEYIDSGSHSEHIRVDFEEQNASVTYFFHENKVLNLTYLCLHEPSEADLFVAFLLGFADYYDYIKNHWVIKGRFFLTVEQEDSCTHFFCRKFVNC